MEKHHKTFNIVYGVEDYKQKGLKTIPFFNEGFLEPNNLSKRCPNIFEQEQP